jgi:NADPH-dependent 2,4-dienoyl-CoA reductase/sulfur reductase-like enzyme
LQAALTAAQRGHDVTIVEMDNHLGGNLIKAADVSFKAEFKKFVNWIIPRVEKHATVVLGTTVDAAYVEAFAPDVLIIAAGAADVVPPIEGVERKHVHFAWQADNGSVPVGEEVVIIGAGLVGTETGIQLAEQGKRVVIVELLGEGPAMAGKGMLGAPAVARALKAGVVTQYETSVERIDEGTVEVRSLVTGERATLKANTVLLAAGIRPRLELVEQLRHTIAEGDVYLVGDLLAGGGTIGHATTSAFEVAAYI